MGKSGRRIIPGAFKSLSNQYSSQKRPLNAKNQGSLYNINLSMKNRDQEFTSGKRLWSKEEDQLLKRIVGEQTSPKWTYISQEFNEAINKSTASTHVSRTNKQCRQRWQNHLNPTLKNHLPWSEDEHRKLFKLFKQYSHQWCQLASKLQSEGFEKRGQNNIKNYFYSAIKRQIKRMNEVIRQNNKQTKKKKSQINQYRKKYGYNPRLSLQRQILGHSALSTKCIFQQFSQHSHPFLPKLNTESVLLSPQAQSNRQASIQESFSILTKPNDLHIIKQLDYELISKILLIAEDKGSKKFVISSNQTKQCHQIAQQLRNQLIELIIQREKPIQKERVRQLAINMLKISRKCKRKSQKLDDNFEEFNFIEDSHNPEKQKIKPSDQAQSGLNPTTQNTFPALFNQKAEIDKYFKEEQPGHNKFFNLDFIRNSQQYKNQQGYNYIPLGIISSYDSGRPLLDSRNLIQKSSDFLCNSNFSMINYFEHHNNINQNFLNSSEINENKDCKTLQNRHLQFISSIREVQPKEQASKPTDLPISQSSLFPARDFSILPSQRKPIIPNSQPSAFKKTSQTPNNDSNDGHFLTHSWALSSDILDQFSRRSSIQNNREEWGFSLPKHNFQNFESQ